MRAISRRAMLSGAMASAAACAAPAAQERPRAEPFTYCLNTSTLRGHKLTLVQELEIASKAGYTGVEPWIGEVDQHVKGGGTLKDVAQRVKDLGLTVESFIAFPEWIVDDDAKRAKGLDEAKRCMDIVREIGGKRIAAPPAGAQNTAGLDLMKAAERYRALLELGDTCGVVPMAEVWGFSKTLGRLSEAVMVAIQSRHPKACVLGDVYHLYRGGSDYEGLKLLGANSMFAIHMNDYPAEPARDKLTDAHRVYPGDGIAPFDTILRDLRDIGFRGALSLELFNRDYWKQDAALVAKNGIEKMKAVVRKALG